MFSIPVAAQTALQDLLEELRGATPEEAPRVLTEIQFEWSRSGSAAMDLLLQRGKDALERGDLIEAVEHLTALTDHAPDFAEGWHARAQAFFHQERFGLAAADLEQTLRLNPDHFGAIRGLGAIFETLNKPDQAFRAYQMAQAYHPTDPEIQDALDRLKNRVTGTDL